MSKQHNEKKLKSLLHNQLKNNLQLNQFLHEDYIDEELQNIVQCYVYDLIDWFRLNMDVELTSALNDPLILLRRNSLEELELVVEGTKRITPLLSQHASI